MRKFEGADGIRGLACLAVIVAHAFGTFFHEYGLVLGGTGKIGVWLFFVLSAFLLTAKFANTGFSIGVIGRYVLGRSIRIIPLYAIAVLIYHFAGMLGLDSRTDVLDAIFFAKGFGHLWTIPVEFKFYALLPFMAYALIQVDQRFGPTATLTVAIAMVLIEQLLWPYWLTPENGINTRWYISSFTIGCYCALAYPYVRARVTPTSASLIGIAVIAIIVMMFPVPRNIVFGMPIDSWLKDKFVYLSVLWAFFILALADGKGILGFVMKMKAMRLLGAWSFSIYLIHMLLYVWLANAHPNSPFWMSFGILSAIGAGATMFYLIERPIEKFRHQLQVRLGERKPIAA